MDYLVISSSKIIDMINLLNQVAAISRKSAEIIEASGERFNMFRVCGVGNHENTHSDIIAEFLNPYGSHGQKHQFLECFIEMLGNKFEISDFNCEGAKVEREEYVPSGRMDFLIEDEQKKKAIIIESKRPADTYEINGEQLEKYIADAETKYGKGNGKKNYQLFYLTIYGDEVPGEYSADKIGYKCLSYSKDIIEWLEKCVAIDVRYPAVKETIIQYINYLKALTNQDTKSKSENEILELISKPENLKDTKHIYHSYRSIIPGTEIAEAEEFIYFNYSAIFNILAKKYFYPKMIEFSKERGLEFITYDTVVHETYIPFDLKYNDKYCINFRPNAPNFDYTISSSEDLDPENEIIKAVRKKLEPISYTDNKKCLVWKRDRVDINIDTWQKDIIESDNFFNDCKKRIEELLTAMEMLEH